MKNVYGKIIIRPKRIERMNNVEIKMDEVLNEEEILKLIEEITRIPKKDNNRCVSSYGSINLDDLINTIKELKKVPTYEDLLRENQKLKVDLNKRRNATEKLVNYFYNLDNFGKESISIDAKIKMLEILTEVLADNKNSEKIY